MTEVVYRPLVRVSLTRGMPTNAFIALIITGLIFVFIIRAYWFALVVIFLYKLFQWMTDNIDEYFFDIIHQQLVYPDAL